MRISLGVNSCFTVKRHAEPETWLGLLGEMGVRFAQVSIDLLDPFHTPPAARAEQVARMKEAAAANGVALQSVFTGTGVQPNQLLLHPHPDARQQALRWHMECAGVASALGAEAWGGIAGSHTLRSVADSAEHERIETEAQALWRRLAEHAASLGLQYLLLEPMSVPREVPTGFAATDRWLEATNDSAAVPTRLCVDVGHLPMGAADAAERDPYEWLRRYGRWSPVVHLQQTDGQRSHHWPFTPERNKAGIIHPERVLEALSVSGAQETVLMLEIFTPNYHPWDERAADDLRVSVEYWRQWVGEETRK